MSSSDVFMLEELRARLQNDEEIIRVILLHFVNDTPRQINEMQLAVASRDSERVRILAHTLKGAAATVAGNELSTLAASVELASKADELEKADAPIRELPFAFARFLEEVVRTGFYSGDVLT